MVTISSYSDTATTNGEVSAGQSSTMKPDLDAGGGGGQASTDFFDMVPSTGVCYISVNMCLLLWYYHQPTEYYDERNAQDETIGNFSMVRVCACCVLCVCMFVTVLVRT